MYTSLEGVRGQWSGDRLFILQTKNISRLRIFSFFFFFFFIRLKDIFIDLKINPTGIKTRIYIGNLVFRDTSEDIKHEIVERNCHIHTFDTKI